MRLSVADDHGTSWQYRFSRAHTLILSCFSTIIIIFFLGAISWLIHLLLGHCYSVFMHSEISLTFLFLFVCFSFTLFLGLQTLCVSCRFVSLLRSVLLVLPWWLLLSLCLSARTTAMMKINCATNWINRRFALFTLHGMCRLSVSSSSCLSSHRSTNCYGAGFAARTSSPWYPMMSWWLVNPFSSPTPPGQSPRRFFTFTNSSCTSATFAFESKC